MFLFFSLRDYIEESSPFIQKNMLNRHICNEILRRTIVAYHYVDIVLTFHNACVCVEQSVAVIMRSLFLSL